MNDVETRHVVSYILDKMGYKRMREDARKGNNIDLYINLIRHKMTCVPEIREFINYFL